MRDASISQKTEDVVIGELAQRAIEKYTLWQRRLDTVTERREPI